MVDLFNVFVSFAEFLQSWKNFGGAKGSARCRRSRYFASRKTILNHFTFCRNVINIFALREKMQNWKKMLVPTTARALVWTSTRTISFVGQTTARAAVCTRACADANNAVAKAELPWEGGKKDWVWNELRPTLHHVAAQPCVTVLMAAAFCAAWSTTTTHVPNHHAKALPTCKKKPSSSAMHGWEWAPSKLPRGKVHDGRCC